jgi:hypothetical protein
MATACSVAPDADDLSDLPTEQIESEVTTLAAHIAAATARFLRLLAELDRREAWRANDCRSLAHWLSWRCGLGLVAAREHVRVARALPKLPLVQRTFEAGEVSYSKVRALTRVARPGTEEPLVDFARVATASQLDRAVRAYERTGGDAKCERERLARRGMTIVHNADGTVTVATRMTRDSFDQLNAALDAAQAEVPHEAGELPETRRADALDAIVRAYLHPRPAAPPPLELVVHVDAVDLASDGSPVAQRLACDASLRVHVGGSDGEAGVMSARRRTVGRALRRALQRRDRETCRFPACTNRFRLHAHHILHFADGGPTTSDNLVLLCPHHHRLVHEGGWRVVGNADGRLTFHDPAGRPVPDRPLAPAATRPDALARLHRAAGVPIDAETLTTATGERMDLDWTVTALHSLLPPETG